MAKKDRYACFQWIRDVRAKMSQDMERMTPEERVAYIHSGAQEVLCGLPELNPEEAKCQLHTILYPEEIPTSSQRGKVTRSRNVMVTTKPIRKGKASKRLAHA